MIKNAFFQRDAVIVAKDLLGKIISVNDKKLRITETEAYTNDLASHGHKKTPRSAIMYDTSGFVYVYFIYGMYHCLNFTTNKIGEPGAVLIRAGKLLDHENENLCSGPGKLCRILDINKKLNGTKIGQKVKLFDDGFKVGKICKSPRIGISAAKELEWRFFISINN